MVSYRAINGELSCHQRQAMQAANNAGGYAPSFHVICRSHGCVMCSDVISELRQSMAVDTLMTSHYSGDVTWIQTEVHVVRRIDAIQLKNASKSIFLTIFKMLT
jgi:hypoxanthine-guanine phosphoribosyltransferase